MDRPKPDNNDVERENAGAAICKPKKRNRQANQEWIREMISVRFETRLNGLS